MIAGGCEEEEGAESRRGAERADEPRKNHDDWLYSTDGRTQKGTSSRVTYEEKARKTLAVEVRRRESSSPSTRKAAEPTRLTAPAMYVVTLDVYESESVRMVAVAPPCA